MQRPRQLVTISVIALVLGGVSLVMSITGLGQWASGNFTGGAVPTYADDELMKLQQRMVSEIAAAMAPWRVFQIPILIILLLSSAFLVFGGVQTLGVREIGRKILLVLFCFLIPFDIVRSVINTMVGHKMSDIMIHHMVKFAGAGQTRPAPNLESWITGASQVGLYASLAFGVLWSAAKITFYVIGLKYFRRPDIVRLFNNKSITPAPPPLPPANKRWD
ncbi:hypothetical protein L0222_26680 [bacterium]|nr:hypothetical protein [bacterium]MCI0605419.1 hypothetical protein [bacterium]